jgi:glucokinase
MDVVAVDLGGTWVRAGQVSPTGEVRASLRVATPQAGPQAVVDAIAGAVRELLGGRPPGRLGVAVPGPLSVREGVVFEPPNLHGWGEVPLRAMLQDRLGCRAVLENDANAAALGEWWRGAGRGSRHMVYVTVSTGVGGGIILDGALHRGASDVAGEVGHVVVDPAGPVCPCGRVGHLEGIAAGPAIVRWVEERLQEGATSSLRGHHPLTAERVAAAAHEGDRLALEAFERAGRYLGWAVGGLLNLLNPEVVVVGGGVARAGAVLFEPMLEAARATAFPRAWEAARVERAVLDDHAGLVGVAYLALQGDGLHTPGR